MIGLESREVRFTTKDLPIQDEKRKQLDTMITNYAHQCPIHLACPNTNTNTNTDHKYQNHLELCLCPPLLPCPCQTPGQAQMQELPGLTQLAHLLECNCLGSHVNAQFQHRTDPPDTTCESTMMINAGYLQLPWWQIETFTFADWNIYICSSTCLQKHVRAILARQSGCWAETWHCIPSTLYISTSHPYIFTSYLYIFTSYLYMFTSHL